MLDGERCQMCVWHNAPAFSSGIEQLAQQGRVSCARLDDGDVR